MKYIGRLLIVLLLVTFLTGCAPSMDKTENIIIEETDVSANTDSSVQKNEKAAVLTMYYPDEHTEKFRFLYNDQQTRYYSGNYYSLYIYEKSNSENIKVVLVGNGMVFYKELEEDEYKVFSGTFAIQNEPVKLSSKNDGTPYIAICDICKQEMVCAINRISVCTTCGTEHFPTEPY